MLCDLIKKISNAFIDEAVASPNLLADMAAMERYMAESYNGRVFIELLQNADDCGSTKIFIKEKNGNIIFANNGRPFNEDDVIAISRSGASNKKRGETIGYRGVGFKSTTYLTDEILIYSDKTYFTFSKKICSEKMNIPIKNIPMIRIPLLVETIEDTIFQEIKELEVLGYTTVFIFKSAKINEFLEEVKQIESGMFIFLNNIKECCVEMKLFSKMILLEREVVKNDKLVKFLCDENDAWYIVTYRNTSIGFKYDFANNKVIPCKEKEQVYHSYLPTYDKMLFPVKVNADFTTDPSRKHITFDEKTEDAIDEIAENISYIVDRVFENKYEIDFSELFTIMTSFGSFSKCNSVLKQQLKNNIMGYLTLSLRNGKKININEYKLLPDWLDEAEKRFLRNKSKHIGSQSVSIDLYNNFKDIDKFIKIYSDQIFSTQDIIDMMSEDVLVDEMLPEMQGKILGKIIRTEKIEQLTTGKKKKLDKIKVSTEEGIKSIKEIVDEKITIDDEVQIEMMNVVSKADMKLFNINASIDTDSESLEVNNSMNEINVKSVKKEIKPHIAKWRSAEQQCLEIEKYFGNSPRDVSKQNLGYDIESIMPNGQKRYIEVKAVMKDGSFSITNNEYTAAHQYSSQYYICLLIQSSINIQAIYIQNPLAVLNFEKRIRQWEWYCEEYQGESFIFEN